MRASIALLTLLAGLSGRLCAAQSPKVAVVYDAPEISVRVTQPSTLRGVVEEFCRVTKSHCELDGEALQALGAETVPAMSIRGTWAETLAQLLAGTSLDYAAFEPAPGQSGRLWVEHRAPATPYIAPASDPAGERRMNFPRTSPRQAASPTAANSDVASDENDPESPRSGERGIASRASHPASAAAPLSRAVAAPQAPGAAVFMDREALPATPPFDSPFPDEKGNPVPVVADHADGSPFPGIVPKPSQEGPANAGQPSESPFPHE
jgi:hypothetical protein